MNLLQGRGMFMVEMIKAESNNDLLVISQNQYLRANTTNKQTNKYKNKNQETLESKTDALVINVQSIPVRELPAPGQAGIFSCEF